MAITAEQVAVADTAVALNTETGATSGTRVTVANRDTETAHLGPSDVTAATGYQLDNGESVTLQLGHGEQLYAISSATGTTVHVLRTGA